MTSDRARELARQLVARADLLLREPAEPDERPSSQRRMSDRLGLRGWLTHPGIALFLNVIAVASVAEIIIATWAQRSPEPAGFGLMLLRILTTWLLAFVPGWIFVRFMEKRIPSIWDRYVVWLYRLGLDQPENLPPPALTSPFYEIWRTAGGEGRLQQSNIYRKKFEARFGASASGTALDRRHRVRVETLLPVFVLTGLLSVCWTAILWDTRVLNLDSTPSELGTSLTFVFLGAYIFGVNMLVRRLLQDELRTAAYWNFLIRVVIGLAFAAGVSPLLANLGADARTQALVMFVAGIFPYGVLRVLQSLALSAQHVVLPSLRPAYPLSDLDGLSVGDEYQLLDAGIEDAQNLATANLTDLLLATDISIPQLIEWINQSLLLLHLGESEHGLASKFRQLGIRTATDLLTVFPTEEMESRSKQRTSTKAALDALADMHVEPTTVRNLVLAVAREPNLPFIVNAKSHDSERSTTAGTKAKPTVPQPPTTSAGPPAL